MEVVNNKAKAAVTKVVTITEATPETFDLIGLTPEQYALLTMLVGNTAHCVKGNLYDKLLTGLGVDNDVICYALDGKHGMPPVTSGIVKQEHIDYILKGR